ncbi:acyltransferase family protein [Symmachiella dynata]|uniref:acyltransferase family protein n=1 Tax=Symmachiella dynata TaxID=2527995 RepID=UPI0030EC8339
MIEFKYRPDVDGLRAIAVVLVVLFHAGLGFPGGFIGVDVFFVISGFLITGLILKQQDSGNFSLTNFWIRRIRRIIPAVTVMVITVLVAGYFLLLPSDYADLGSSTIAQQLMLSNVYFWQNTGYFDGPADLKPLLHTWSLAVEEQFYLFYPFLLIFLHRFGRRTTIIAIGLLALGSLAVSQYGVENHRSATFFLLPTRAWELLIGGLICFLPKPTRIKPKILVICSWLSLGAILGAGWSYTSTTPFPGLAALVPCVATAALIYANSLQQSFPAAVLASRPFVVVGLTSYSLYLWHWPILAFLRYRFGQELSMPTISAALCSSVVLGFFSWRCVETPIRQKKLFASTYITIGTAVSFLAVICLSGVVIQSSGLRSRFSGEFLAVVEIPYAGHDAGAKGSVDEGWTLPVIGEVDGDASTPKFVLWGDSFSKCLSSLVDEVAAEHGISGYDAGLGGTPPLIGSWTGTENSRKANAFNDFVLKTCNASSVDWIILFAAWDIHANGMSHLRDEKSGNSFEAFKRGFEHTLSEAEKSEITVVVILQHPYQRKNVPSKVARQVLSGRTGNVYGVSRSDHLTYQEKTRGYFASLGDRIVLVDADKYCFDSVNDLSLIGRDHVPYYSDGGHPSREGVRVFFKELISDIFAEIKER